MKAAAKKIETCEIVIESLATETVNLWIMGTSGGFIYNAMSEKAKRSLLFPPGPMTAADKAQKMKHNPVEEFRNSTYQRRGDGPTRFTMKATAWKRAMMTAALETPGAKKTQIGRLIWVNGEHVDMYGVPKLLMASVIQAGISRAPDIRTRAILPEWCCKVSLSFVKPQLSAIMITRLLETAGLICGVGDWRQEKGAGNYGQFRCVDASECAHIVKKGGMAAQDAALKADIPECHDLDSESLLDWFVNERQRRGK